MHLVEDDVHFCYVLDVLDIKVHASYLKVLIKSDCTEAALLFAVDTNMKSSALEYLLGYLVYLYVPSAQSCWINGPYSGTALPKCPSWVHHVTLPFSLKKKQLIVGFRTHDFK